MSDNDTTTTPGYVEFEEFMASDPALSAASPWYRGLTLIGAPHQVGYPYWVGIFPQILDGHADQAEEWSLSIGRDPITRNWHIDLTTNELMGHQLSDAGTEALILALRAAQAAQRAMDAGYTWIEPAVLDARAETREHIRQAEH